MKPSDDTALREHPKPETPISGYFTVSVAVLETPPPVAVMVAVVVAGTFEVFTTKLAEVRPAATVTLVPTFAELELLLRSRTKPPAGAEDVSVTVPVLEAPPFTDPGDNVSDFTEGGVIASVAE